MTPEEIAALPYRHNVGMMLVNPAGKIFAGQRIDAARLGTGETAWQMPQGGIDPGEEPRTAALRELEEEIGVGPELVRIEAEYPGWLTYDLPIEIVPKIWKGRYRGQKQRWFLMRFLGSDDQIVIETAHPEFRRWAWLSPEELIARIVPFKRDVYEQVLAEFGDRL
ncbi:MAG: RNA pyrophosphohydrolase [Alphaproteobacteria bacterium]|nr:MAG: RNA pyrophosphohydrolase [Alphaproteobacteria bacterium]